MKLIRGDCLDYLSKLGDKSIDVILTDPPYGKKADKGTNGFGSAKNRRYQGGWDNEIPTEIVFNEMLRVSKRIILFGGNYFAHLLPPSKCWIVWDKKGDVKFKNPFADCELIYTNYTKPIKKYAFRQQGFITDSKDKRFHPTQKPTELIQRILKDYVGNEGTVLDPFMGSGSTGVAAKKTGLDFVGIEINEEYFQIAKQRIKRA